MTAFLGLKMKIYDVIIIGAGPTGDFLAARLRERKKRVAVVGLPGDPESNLFKQALALRAEIPLTKENFSKLSELGNSGNSSNSDKFMGPGQFISRDTFQIGNENLKAPKFIINSGAIYDLPKLNSSAGLPIKTPLEILTDPNPSKSVTVLGPGPAALVLSQKLAQKGCRVYLALDGKNLLPGEDPEVEESFVSLLEKEGVKIISDSHPGIQDEVYCAAKPLVPNSSNMNLEACGVTINADRAIVINEECRTSAPRIWAVGAVTGEPFEFSLEKRQAEIILDNIDGYFFSKIKMDSDPIPFVIPTDPPFARLGPGEEEAKINYKKGLVSAIYPLKKSPGAIIQDKENGWIKLLGKRRGAELLGAQVFAPHAEEIILFFDLVLRARIPLSEFNERNHFPFGTFGEAIYEAIETLNEKIYF